MRSPRLRLVAFLLFAGLMAALVFAPREATAQKGLPAQPGGPPTGEQPAEQLEKLSFRRASRPTNNSAGCWNTTPKRRR